MEPVILNKKYQIIDDNLFKMGAYGAVFKAINIQTNQIVAIKQIKKSVGQEGLTQTVIRQNAILNSLKNSLKDKNIVTLLQTFINNKTNIYLVFPFLQMNLRQFVVNKYNSNIPQSVIKKIMSQLLSAVKTAHNARFMHRDIKMQNILIQKSKQNPNDFTIKLADWGSSRKFNTGTNQNFTDYVIPRIYRPPELLFRSRKYSQSVDMWSIGCLFYQLLFGKLLFPYVQVPILLQKIQEIIGLSQNDDYNWIQEMYSQSNLQFNQEALKQYRKHSLDQIFKQKYGSVTPACDLLKVKLFVQKKMLKINPQKRISASDALKHYYFDITQ